MARGLHFEALDLPSPISAQCFTPCMHSSEPPPKVQYLTGEKGCLAQTKKKKYQGEFRVKKYVLENPSSEQFYCPEQHVKRCLTPALCSPGALHRDRFQWAFTGISEEGLTALIPPNDPTLTLQVPWWKWFALPVPALTPCSAVLMSTGRGNHSISVA